MEHKAKFNSRRDFIRKSAILTASAVIVSNVDQKVFGFVANKDAGAMKQFLPPLPYTYDALEPHIDKLTMEIHYSKHHQAYVDKLNVALDESRAKGIKVDGSMEEICKNISKYSTAIKNNAGGHYNHTLFWSLMSPKGGGEPAGKLGVAIREGFESFEKFKVMFTDFAKGVFGSGWVWLVVDDKGRLVLGTTPNQDNPLMPDSILKGNPVLALDVWEHAYYLKNQNRRMDYINSWWNVVNWNEAEQLYLKHTK